MERKEAERKTAEVTALQSIQSHPRIKRSVIQTLLLVTASLTLLACFYLGFKASGSTSTEGFKTAVIWPTAIYFIAATALVFIHKDKIETSN
jgi:hypothetical protein